MREDIEQVQETEWKKSKDIFERAKITNGIPTARLRELVALDAPLREGRVKIFPFKFGEPIFVLAHCGDVRYFCDNDYENGTGECTCPFKNVCEIEECDNDDLHVFEVDVAGVYLDADKPETEEVIINELDVDISFSDFGKTAFTDKKDAVRALSGAGEGGE